MDKVIQTLASTLVSVFHQNEEQAKYFVESSLNYVLQYTNRKEYKEELKSVVIDLALFYIQANGLGGVKSRSEGAISESYIDTTNIPKSILDRLNVYRLVHLAKEHAG